MDRIVQGLSPSARIRLSFIIVVILATGIVVVFGVGYIENQHRIHELHKNRLVSCQTTYKAFILVFKPFLPKRPLTKAEQNRQDVFYRTVNGLINQCREQINGEKINGRKIKEQSKVKKEE